MDELSVNLNKQQIGTKTNHMMYADDLCIFSPSASGLRKITEYGNMFDITYNANKSCSIIDNKPQDKNKIHHVVINNHTLPHTEKYKYLGHIINNNLTDDDDDIARQTQIIYAQANVLSRTFLVLRVHLVHDMCACACVCVCVCVWIFF